MRITRRGLSALALSMPSLAVAQQRWSPERPVTFLTPFAAGGAFHVTQRALARAAEQIIGHPIQVMNRLGAAGTIMLGELLRARPDGARVAVPEPSGHG